MLRSNFWYNGKSLSDFQMKMFDPETESQSIERTVDKASQTSAREVPNHYATYYNGVLQHHMLIIKDPELFESSNELRLTQKEINCITAWLYSTTLPSELIVPQDDEEIDIRYFGVFTGVQPYMPVRKTCFGLHLTFTCNAPYGFSPVTSKRFYLNNADISGDYLNSAVEFAKMVPPTIIINATNNTTFHGEMLHITNKHDHGRTMHIKLPDGTDQIKIDCRTKVVTGRYNGIDRPLTLSDIGMLLFKADVDNTEYFQLLDLYSDIYWLTLNNGNNALRFVTETDSFTPYTVEIQTRYIIEAGGC